MCRKSIYINIINKLCVGKVRAEGPGGRTGRKFWKDGRTGRKDGPGGRKDRAEGRTTPPPTKILKIMFFLEHGKDAHRNSAKGALNDSSRSLIWIFLEQTEFLKIGEHYQKYQN